MAMIYAGIGSRQTPETVRKAFRVYAKALADRGWVLRSGHAEGADKAFEWGATALKSFDWGEKSSKKEIFTARDHTPEWAFETVDKYHPAPHNLSDYARRLHARNAMIILGADGLRPVDLVLCWTKDGKMQGGTAQALRIAEDYQVPVINFGLLS